MWAYTHDIHSRGVESFVHMHTRAYTLKHLHTNITMCVCTALVGNIIISKQGSRSLLQRTFPEHLWVRI